MLCSYLPEFIRNENKISLVDYMKSNLHQIPAFIEINPLKRKVVETNNKTLTHTKPDTKMSYANPKCTKMNSNDLIISR